MELLNFRLKRVLNVIDTNGFHNFYCNSHFISRHIVCVYECILNIFILVYTIFKKNADYGPINWFFDP